MVVNRVEEYFERENDFYFHEEKLSTDIQEFIELKVTNGLGYHEFYSGFRVENMEDLESYLGLMDTWSRMHEKY